MNIILLNALKLLTLLFQYL